MTVDPLIHLREAIHSLGRGDAATARSEMALAVASEPSLRSTADAVALACAQLDADGGIEPSAWDVLADSCPSDMRDVVESTRA